MSIAKLSSDSSTLCFELDPNARLAWRTWDGETVTHHAMSNDTHRLAEPAGAVLQRLASAGPQDSHSLVRACDLPPDELEHVLAALADLNLVRPQC